MTKRKDKWELLAEIRDVIKHGGTEEHSKLARRIVRAFKAERLYRKVKKARICPIGTPTCLEAGNDKSKMCSICWREFERR